MANGFMIGQMRAAEADNLGFYHKQSNVFTIDFDDKNYVAHRYLSLFPHTLTEEKIYFNTIHI